jgi:hypothetical protein
MVLDLFLKISSINATPIALAVLDLVHAYREEDKKNRLTGHFSGTPNRLKAMLQFI